MNRFCVHLVLLIQTFYVMIDAADYKTVDASSTLIGRTIQGYNVYKTPRPGDKSYASDGFSGFLMGAAKWSLAGAITTGGASIACAAGLTDKLYKQAAVEDCTYHDPAFINPRVDQACVTRSLGRYKKQSSIILLSASSVLTTIAAACALGSQAFRTNSYRPNEMITLEDAADIDWLIKACRGHLHNKSVQSVYKTLEQALQPLLQAKGTKPFVGAQLTVSNMPIDSDLRIPVRQRDLSAVVAMATSACPIHSIEINCGEIHEDAQVRYNFVNGSHLEGALARSLLNKTMRGAEGVCYFPRDQWTTNAETNTDNLITRLVATRIGSESM